MADCLWCFQTSDNLISLSIHQNGTSSQEKILLKTNFICTDSLWFHFFCSVLLRSHVVLFFCLSFPPHHNMHFDNERKNNKKLDETKSLFCFLWLLSVLLAFSLFRARSLVPGPLIHAPAQARALDQAQVQALSLPAQRPCLFPWEWSPLDSWCTRRAASCLGFGRDRVPEEECSWLSETGLDLHTASPVTADARKKAMWTLWGRKKQKIKKTRS